METRTDIVDGKAMVVVEGKLTVQTSPELGAVLSGLPAEVREVDIDLSNVDYISSAGLRVLVAAEKRVLTDGGQMRLLHPRDEVLEVFEMTGLSDVFTIEAR